MISDLTEVFVAQHSLRCGCFDLAVVSTSHFLCFVMASLQSAGDRIYGVDRDVVEGRAPPPGCFALCGCSAPLAFRLAYVVSADVGHGRRQG